MEKSSYESTILNSFYFALYLSTISDLDQRVQKQLNEIYLNAYEKYFELVEISSNNEWISKCLKRKHEMKNFLHTFKYSNLLQFLNQTKLVRNLIEFSLEILSIYGLDFNQFFVKPTNTKEHFTFLAAKILEDLFLVD